MKRTLSILTVLITLASCQIGPKIIEPWSDREPPVLTVDELFEGRETGLSLAVSGTASDNVEVEGVYLAVDSATNEKIPGTTNWQTNLTLSAGSHILSFYAKDTAGLISPFQTFTVNATASPDTNRPSVVISYPDGFNAVGFFFTASGTASDNTGLEGVYLSLDFGSFRKLMGTSSWSSDLSVGTIGTHQVSVYSRDMAGNRSPTNNRIFSVNPSMPTVQIESPTNQEYTSNNIVSVHGKASDDGMLAGVFLEVDTNGYGLVSGTTNWQTNIVLPAVSGWVAVHAYARDTLSNQSPPAVANLYLDMTRPSNSVTSPTNNQLILYSTFSIYGKISDNTLPLEGCTVRMSLNNSPGIMVPADRYGNWSTNITLTNAWYTNTVYALDLVGNSSSTDTIIFRVKADVEYPVAEITNVSDGSAVTNPVTFRGIATDDSAVSAVYLILDNTTTNTAIGTDVWSRGPFTLSNGFHQAEVFAVDMYGRVGLKRGISFFADSLPPLITFNSSNVSGLDYHFWYEIQDPGGIYLFAYTYTGSSWQTNTNDSFPATGLIEDTLSLTQGVYLFRSFAEDRFGHATPVQSNYLIVDTNRPTSALTEPTNAQYLRNTVMIDGLSTDNIGVQKVFLAVNSTNFVQIAQTNTLLTNLSWSLSTNLPEGTNVVETISLDFVDNVSLTNQTVFLVDLTQPVLTVTNPGDGETLPSSFVYSGSASDNFALLGIFISVDGSLFIKVSDSSPWNTNLSLSAGPHELRAYAADRAGNCSPTNVINVTVTNT